MTIKNMASAINQTKDVDRYEAVAYRQTGRTVTMMEDRAEGDYVRYADYAALQQQLSECQERLAVAEADIGRIDWLDYQFEKSGRINIWQKDNESIRSAIDEEMEP